MSEIDPACDYVHQPDAEPELPAPVDYDEVTITLRWKIPTGVRNMYIVPVSVGQVGDVARAMLMDGHEPRMGRLEVTGHNGSRTVYTHKAGA